MFVPDVGLVYVPQARQHRIVQEASAMAYWVYEPSVAAGHSMILPNRQPWPDEPGVYPMGTLARRDERNKDEPVRWWAICQQPALVMGCEALCPVVAVYQAVVNWRRRVENAGAST